MRPGPQKIWLVRVAARPTRRRGSEKKRKREGETTLQHHLLVFLLLPLGWLYTILPQPRLKLGLIKKTVAAAAAAPLVALKKNGSISMAGVQVMPAVGAATTVDVRADGGRAAALRKRRVGDASGSGRVSSTSLFVGDWRRRPRRPACSLRLRQCRSRSKRGLGIVSNLGGQYEDGFEDVHVQLMNFFTYKAVRTVLNQLYEMNPPSYRWFHNFVAVNKPTDGKLFLRALGKERQELAERVMITRLHLYGKWIKKCDHAMIYEKISDENLALMRERLMETVIWPTDDTNTEKIG